MRVLLAGGSGMIGRALRRRLTARGHAVRALVRRPAAGPDEHAWDATVGSVPPGALAWSDAVVSLNGAPLARLPWTKAYRRQIMDSRVDATAALAAAILDSDSPPRVWASGSATGIHGEGFLAAVTRAWEAAALPAAAATRLVRLRTGMVLAPGEGALRPLTLATKAGLGMRIGGGDQFWPWISLRDEARAIIFTLEDESLAGPADLVGPTLATAEQITRALAQALRRPHILAAPAALLRAALGAAAEEMLLASQPIRPQALQAHGFEFRDQTAAAAVAAAHLSGQAEHGA
ncbi:MAG: TIGR01777 family oxidoreductase [Bifidobacteriaceae bacterium]|nr:TIGR01777 family oxidoreductase [Bifidobacteriaceae bacterium]